jgi:hypothetical protein
LHDKKEEEREEEKTKTKSKEEVTQTQIVESMKLRGALPYCPVLH